MVAASLSLLQGNKGKAEVKTEAAPATAAPEVKKSNVSIAKKAPVEVTPEVETKVAEVAEAPATAPAVVPEAAEDGTIEIEKMTSKQIDALVAEHNVEVPDNWKKMTVGDKRKWLTEKFGVEEGEPEKTEADVTAAETATGKELGPATKDKPKAAAKAAVDGEVLAPDLITDIVHSIENLKEKDARELVRVLGEQAEENFFKIGGVLSLIQVNQWFKPYSSLRELIETEYGMEYRRGMHWVAIYNALVESKVPFKKVAGIGWTKLKEIARVIDADNVDDWVEIAKNQPVATLIETVRNSIKAASGQAPALEDGTAVTKTVTVKTFKVHDDQLKNIDAALDKAKEASGTKVDTVALEFMALDYLGAKTIKAPDLVTLLKGDGSETALEEALNALATAWPDYNFKVEAP